MASPCQGSGVKARRRGLLSPQSGERYGEGPVAKALPVAERNKNGVAHTIDLLVNLDIAEANNPIAAPLHKKRPRAVFRNLFICRMGRAVDFDDELCFAAGEVGIIGTDTLLPNEFMPTQRAVAQSAP